MLENTESPSVFSNQKSTIQRNWQHREKLELSKIHTSHDFFLLFIMNITIFLKVIILHQFWVKKIFP
jgi:hypothetical protein